MKTWIIGNTEGSIGATLQEMMATNGTVIGTGTEVDVRDQFNLNDFLVDEGPFDNVVYCAGIASLQ